VAARLQSQSESFGLHYSLYTKFNLLTIHKKNECDHEIIITKITAENISCDNDLGGVVLDWNFF
jgi:hypothetical protein